MLLFLKEFLKSFFHHTQISAESRSAFICSIIQTIASTFAIVLAISLTIAQLLTKYSVRVLGRTRRYVRITLTYSSLYILVLALSLIAYFYQFDHDLLIIALLSFFSMIMIVPFLVQFRKELSPQRIITDISEGISKKLDKAENGSIIDSIKEDVDALVDISVSSLYEPDYYTFRESMRALVTLPLEISKRYHHSIEHLPNMKIAYRFRVLAAREEISRNEMHPLEYLLLYIAQRNSELSSFSTERPYSTVMTMTILERSLIDTFRQLDRMDTENPCAIQPVWILSKVIVVNLLMASLYSIERRNADAAWMSMDISAKLIARSRSVFGKILKDGEKKEEGLRTIVQQTIEELLSYFFICAACTYHYFPDMKLLIGKVCNSTLKDNFTNQFQRSMELSYEFVKELWPELLKDFEKLKKKMFGHQISKA